MARWLGAAAVAALVIVMACERISEHGMKPGELEQSRQDLDAEARAIDDRWSTPDPWAIDSDEHTLAFGREPAGLSEFFEENPQRFAHGEAGDFEWPYVWEGKDARGMRSGYDWQGASTAVKVHDEVVPRWSLPMARRPRAALSQLRLQSLSPSSYTDFTMSGDGVRCVCDSAAAGDEEMEGLDPNVRPACTCTGGRRTSFSGTEEGGPLDTGAEGAWPQGLPDNGGVAYIDGGSTRAYKSISAQSLAALPSQMEHKWITLVKLAEDALSEGGNSSAVPSEASEPAEAKEDDGQSAVEGSEGNENADAQDSVEDETKEEGGEEVREGEGKELEEPSAANATAGDEAQHSSSAAEVEAKPTWWKLHHNPSASPLDRLATLKTLSCLSCCRNLVERFRRVFRIFLSESAYCDELGERDVTCATG
ncbi:hypothetical protein GUITHDRAFT_165169 [Guillardia theta CCMP2712]|uniref:Uncharacterized protein n=1 Tax=Guillardia theta (strain CCMP2712) TaxID=905079 RepID=L1IR27_GUITC|nr:hypothetical protein GUITHDRAFT_165169 [Guillardia theta CCMP2712]EKX38713.1 hypothetical protein GUITHDRAFT_165169 [Guillardia theta CCMP2712]|eukprot:XP_005825693.1 hypothetical protein GUITHDRAFT_165169 [Guillardia theta CCMP2712]